MSSRAGPHPRPSTSPSMRPCDFLAPGAPARSRLDALCAKLHALGGAGPARLLTSALDRRFGDNERRRAARDGEGRGSEPDDRDEGERWMRAEDARAAAAAADVLVDAAWEKLHAGDWKDVDDGWRELYVLGVLLKVDTAWREARKGRNAQTTQTAAGKSVTPRMSRTEALRSLDVAALLGGPAFRDELEAAITAVQEWTTDPDVVRDGNVRRSSKRPRDGEKGWRLGSWGKDGDGNLEDAPPPIASTSLPPGSLSEGASPLRSPVKHLEVPPSLESFYCNHMVAGERGCGVPVLLAGAASHWPALQRWRDPDYLRQVTGCRTVPVEMGEHYLHRKWTQKLMTMADFLDNHVRPRPIVVDEDVHPDSDNGGHNEESCPDAKDGTSASRRRKVRRMCKSRGGKKSDGSGHASGSGGSEKGYLAQHALFEQIPALLRDIDLPDYCALCRGADEEGGEEGGVQVINAWLGPAGTVSPLHTDPHHNLLTQTVGYKYVRLYAPQLAPAMYPHVEPKLSNSSRVDARLLPDTLAARGFPLFTTAPYSDCVLGPGDMLYIPPEWFHYVQSLTSSFSVSFWWR